jgi:hypothetical protein
VINKPARTSGSKSAKKTLVFEVWWALARPTKYKNKAQIGMINLPTIGMTLTREIAPEA